MTAPAAGFRGGSPVELEVATYRFDSFVLPGLATLDDLGREWSLTGEEGWNTVAAPRTAREKRGDGHGSYRSIGWRDELTFTISGTVHVDDPALLERTERDLAGVLADAGRLYTVRRTAGAYDETRMAEIDARPEITPVGRFDIDFQWTLAAPDPRKHAYYRQERRMTGVAIAAGGLDYIGGLDYTGGLDYVSAPSPVLARVANYGTAPAAPWFVLVGPMSPPTVRHLELGVELSSTTGISAGETVIVNCDEHPIRVRQQGVHERRAVSTARGDVSSEWTALPDWPVVAPSSAATFQLLTSGTPADDPIAGLRSAWW